ncbi:MAG: alginate export family protein [Akkermansiaceae bacterium]
MKNINTTLKALSLSLLITPSVFAEINTGDFLKFSGIVTTRYEFRETDPLDPSHALTARARVGLTLGEFNGFSAFVEGEGTQGIIEDYRSNPTGNDSTRPYVPGNSVIADPNNAELNQAYLKYDNEGFLVQVGRQRIIRNSAAFIGNVGWRQNEQTFDAAQIGYSKDKLSVSYVFSDRVQRIFGADANDAPPGPPLRDFEGDFHFFDLSYDTECGEVGGYAYLIDVDNNAAVGESNTFGAFIEANGFYGEIAYQDGSSSLVRGGDYDAMYGHLKYSTKAWGGTVMFGVEYLEDNFKTPFATVHAFNGFADAFILQRIGLNKGPGGNYDGITDFYVGYVKPGLPCGLTFKGSLHAFMDGDLDATYGYEADAVLVKKINDNTSALLKAAYFSGEDFYEDIKQVSVQLDYKF